MNDPKNTNRDPFPVEFHQILLGNMCRDNEKLRQPEEENGNKKKIITTIHLGFHQSNNSCCIHTAEHFISYTPWLLTI